MLVMPFKLRNSAAKWSSTHAVLPTMMSLQCITSTTPDLLRGVERS